MRSLLFVVALSIAACSSSSSDNGAPTTPSDDGGSADAGNGFPADHPALPQVINMGGSVMASPKFIAITFPGDTLVDDITSFSDKIGASQYWTAVTSEYGVGPATSTSVAMTTAPATQITDDDIQTFLKAQFGTTLPEPDGSTIYALYYPDGVGITDQGATACTSFGGYHGDFAIGGGKFASYAVMPRCPSDFPGVSVLDTLTAAASHEYIEAATDPLALSAPAFGNVDANGGGWAHAGGGAEVGDMCATLGNVFTKTTDVPYLVQRSWSNAAAAASHDPCVPQGLSPFFAAAPVLPDSASVRVVSNTPQAVNLVHIPVGQSQTIELDLFSDADTQGAFDVSMIDLTSAFTGGPTELTFTQDNTSGQNGDKINVTITAVKKDATGFAPYLIQSTLGSNMTYWVGIVEN